MFRTDFRNPYYRLYILDPTGSVRVPLWLHPDESKRAQEYSKFKYEGISLACVTDVTVEMKGANGLHSVSVTLNPTYNDGVAILNSDLINQDNLLEVQFGYMSGDEGWMSEKLVGTLGLPDVTLGMEMSITLKTMAPKAQSASTQQHVKVYNNKSTKDILSEVASRRGIDIKFLVSDSKKKDLDKPMNVTQSGETDWFFMRKLAWRLGCSVAFAMPGELSDAKEDATWVIVRDSPYIPEDEPKRYFRLMPGQYIDAQKGGPFPIFSLSTSSEHMFVPGAMRNLRAIGLNSKSAEKEEVEVKPGDAVPNPNSPHTSKEGAGAPLPNDPNEGVVDGKQEGTVVFEQPKEATSEVRAAAEAARELNLGAIEFEIETLGLPDMIPYEAIYLDGIGDRYNGKFIVQEVTHTLGQSGYSTKFKANLFLPAAEKSREKLHASASKKAEKTGPDVTANAKTE